MLTHKNFKVDSNFLKFNHILLIYDIYIFLYHRNIITIQNYDDNKSLQL